MSALWGAVAGQPVFNLATGGTVSTFTYNGKTYRRHLFTTAGSATFTVLANPRQFRVRLIGGGGDSGLSDSGAGEGSPGGSGGGYENTAATLPIGAITLQIGAHGTAAASSDTVITGIGTCGGGGNGRRGATGTGETAGRAGTWGGNSTGGNGQTGGAYVTPNDPSASFRTLVDGTVGTWGRYGPGAPGVYGTTYYNQGKDGMVCIEYEIG